MANVRMRVSLTGLKPSVSREFSIPEDVSFLDLHLALQAMAGWSDRESHCFRTGEKKIGPKNFGVSEEADEMLSEYRDTRMAYEYGPYRLELMFLKGKTQTSDFPIITGSAGYFPPEECKDLEEYMDVLGILEDPSDPSFGEISSWMESVRKSQDVSEINKELSDGWERMGKIAGRIPFNVGATIGALLITGCEGYYYDTEKRILTEESDGSARYLPIEPSKDEFVATLAGIYADMNGIESDNILETLLEDEYRPEWEEYAENFLDDVTDRWADPHNLIVESYGDSDISKMMDVFDDKLE